MIRILSFVFLATAGIISLSIIDSEEEAIAVPPVSQSAWVEAKLGKMTLEEKIGQFFMLAAYSNKGENHFASLDSAITMNHVGGLIFF